MRSLTLNEINFNHLLSGRWQITEHFSKFVMNDKQMPEKDRLIGQLNYWQSIKWQGRYNDIIEEVKKSDFSAKDSIFQLAIAAIKDSKKEFFNLLPEIIKQNKLSIEDIKTWPIFKEMRKGVAFKRFIKSVEVKKSKKNG